MKGDTLQHKKEYVYSRIFFVQQSVPFKVEQIPTRW